MVTVVVAPEQRDVEFAPMFRANGGALTITFVFAVVEELLHP